MVEVVVVCVEETKNIYYLSPNSIKLNKGTKVIFEDEVGLLNGVVIKNNYSEDKKNLVLPLKKVLRVVTDKDLSTIEKNIKFSNSALSEAKKIGNQLNLNMNFVDAYLNFDSSQLLISFVSDERVDFRELVKKLAQKYKMRIELRQIGVRDKSKKIGGLGPCGLFLCCSSFLTDFNSVSINMAKNQMLALNPSKINGICGRLLCCLGYENDGYTELKKSLPKVGLTVDTPEGMGKVTDIDILKNTYTVDLGEKGIMKFPGEKRDEKGK